MRHSVRRFAALFSGVLLLQLVLVGSGFACALPVDMAANATDVSSTMPGMDMGGPAQAPSPSKAPSSDPSPCRLPWVPAGCQSMAPCAPTVIASSAISVSLPHLTTASVVRLIVLTPPSRAIPPELPPPRA